MGFLGILETSSTSVPSTVQLDEHWVPDTDRQAAHHRHATGKNSQIVLVPQPADDPNDPLNWHPLKKLSVTLIIGFGSCLYAAAYGHLFDAGTVVLAQTFQRPIPDIVKMSGYQLLAAGATGPLVAACARKWGKRPVFIVSSLLGLIGSIIGAVRHDYAGFLAARLVQGLSMPAYESIVGSIVGDMYFVHQRGFFISIIGFVLAVVSNLAPVVCGAITFNLSWKYLFYLCVPITAIQTIMLALFAPETQYKRPLANPSDTSDSEASERSSTEVKWARDRDVKTSSDPQPSVPTKKSMWQEIAMLTGTHSEENLVQLMIAPFAVCTNLIVLWSVLLSGYLTATYVAQAYVLAQIFAAPPYLLNAAGIGYLFLGPFIGGTLASILFAVVMDPLIKFCSWHNRGVYEPEYRLIALIGGLLVGAGLLGWGALVQEGASVYAAATLHGLVMFGVVIANDTLYTYTIDAFREISSEVFVASAMVKNFVFFGFSYFVSAWMATEGPQHVFDIFGGISMGLIVSGLVVFFFGKRYRGYWARHNLLESLHVKGHGEW